jgi:RNA polymerase sigma-70 factor (ECF subfamily)
MESRRELDPRAMLDLGPSAPWRIEDLFRDHNETLLRFLRARLNSDADAREAAQEAYARLLQLDQPDQPSFLRAYLFKVASNVATDILRQRGVRLASSDTGEERQVLPALQERALAAKQQLAAVQKALDELPPRCREAFLLSRREGFGTVEIAARLNVTDRQVRNYLIRALEHLRAALQAESPR